MSTAAPPPENLVRDLEDAVRHRREAAEAERVAMLELGAAMRRARAAGVYPTAIARACGMSRQRVNEILDPSIVERREQRRREQAEAAAERKRAAAERRRANRKTKQLA